MCPTGLRATVPSFQGRTAPLSDPKPSSPGAKLSLQVALLGLVQLLRMGCAQAAALLVAMI